MLSLQTLFTQGTQHLVRQGEGAVDELGSCRYRLTGEVSGETTKCAVGYFVTDKAYDKWCSHIEGVAVSAISSSTDVNCVQNALIESVGCLNNESFELLSDMQHNHDTSIGYISDVLHAREEGTEDELLRDWAQLTVKTAERWGLIVPKQVTDLL